MFLTDFNAYSFLQFIVVRESTCSLLPLVALHIDESESRIE